MFSRIIFAALVSALGFFATFYWYKATEPKKKIERENLEPIAYLFKSTDETTRKPVSRIIWQLLNPGDPLYPGEAIRTSSRGEARIQFSGSDRYLDVEADSVIVLQKSKNEISLDLMEGSVFVDSSKSAGKGPSLALKTSKGKIDISKAAVSFAGSSSKKIDLQVIKGEAFLSGAGKSQKIETGKSAVFNEKGTELGKDQSADKFSEQFTLLSPDPLKPLVMDADKLQPVSFRWSGITKKTNVSLFTGPNRRELKDSGTPPIDALTGEIQASLEPGKYFWKLVAVDPINPKNLIESAIQKLEIETRKAPLAIAPKDTLATYVPKGTTSDVTFQWINTENYKYIVLELASDEKMNSRILQKTFSSSEPFVAPKLKEANYYWRLSGFYNEKERPIMGRVQRFSITSSKDKKEKINVALAWKKPTENKTIFYTTARPQMSLGWEADNGQVVSFYRLKVAEENQSLDKAEAIEGKSTHFTKQLNKPGRYIAMVEALDGEKDVIGKSQIKTIEYQPLPLLAAPKIIGENEIKANNFGSGSVAWAPITGAKDYELVLQDKKGGIVDKQKFTTPTYKFKDLVPGKYSVQIFANDEYGRKGEIQNEVSIQVPDGSAIGAPKLKGIRIK